VKLLSSTLLAVLLLIFACKPAANNTNEQPAANDDTLAVTKLPGVYMGDFGNGNIYITLNYSNGKQVAGYNVHKGLRRNLRGEVKRDNDNWVVTLTEPGDHPFDGKFALTFDHQFAKGKGTWTPLNNTSLKTKSFDLQRTEQGDYTMTGNTFSMFLVETDGAKSDFAFDPDGSCLLQYYEKINDSTFAEQMIKVKGTYQKATDSTVTINWEKNTLFKERTNTYKLKGDTDSDGKRYYYGIVIDTLEFVQGP